MAHLSGKSDISDMDGDTLRERLSERLAATGKKAVPLAKRIGRGRDYLTDILNGKKDTLSSDTLTALARELGCDERYFTDVAFAQPGRPRHPATLEQLAAYGRAAAAADNYLLAWRDFKGLSHQDLADETKLSVGTIIDIETGNARPTDDQLAALARAVDATVGAIISQNPFETDQRIARLATISEGLDLRDQATLLDMAEAMMKRQAS